MPQKMRLEQKILNRIRRFKKNVMIREDFADLGNYDQVGSVLRRLMSKGYVIRIGYGLYAKAERSPLSGNIIPIRSLPSLAKEALSRLHVTVVPSRIEQDYNSGKSTQVPTGRMIAVTSRISRKIGYNGVYISYEYTPGQTND